MPRYGKMRTRATSSNSSLDSMDPMSDAMKEAAIAEIQMNKMKRYHSKDEKAKVKQILKEKPSKQQIANKVHQMTLRTRNAESDKQMKDGLHEVVNAFQGTPKKAIDSNAPLEASDPKMVILAQKNLKLMSNKEAIKEVKKAKELQSKFPRTLIA